MENEITNDEFQKKLEEIEEFAWRWKNHKKMLKIIHESNVNPETVKRWESQIDQCFREKIKSKL